VGGRGSGNRWNNNTPRYYGTVEDVPFVLDVRWLSRKGVLRPDVKSGALSGKWRTTAMGSWREWSVGVYPDMDAGVVTLRASVGCDDGTGELRDASQTIRLDWTPCHLGGRRAWFCCPYCGRRCALLYGTGGVDAFGWRCQRCARLRHASTRESELDRAIRRVRKMRRDVFRLPADDPSVRAPLMWTGSVPRRPVGMHRRTYERNLALFREAERWMNACWMYDLAASLAAIGGSVGQKADPLIDGVLAEGPPRRHDVTTW